MIEPVTTIGWVAFYMVIGVITLATFLWKLMTGGDGNSYL